MEEEGDNTLWKEERRGEGEEVNSRSRRRCRRIMGCTLGHLSRLAPPISAYATRCGYSCHPSGNWAEIAITRRRLRLLEMAQLDSSSFLYLCRPLFRTVLCCSGEGERGNGNEWRNKRWMDGRTDGCYSQKTSRERGRSQLPFSRFD